MEFTDRDIRHLEALAALRLSDSERQRLREQLQRILEYIELLSAIDVEGVPPSVHGFDADNPLREDRVLPSLPTEIALGNAPDARGPFYRVPRFVGEQEVEP